MLMNRAGHEGLRAAAPERRPFIVSRSGWAGSQRYAWNWTGDVESTWAGLRQQVATVVGLGLSGIAYSGPDIGGFSGIPDDELYLRWLSMAVLLPFCRTHSVVGVPPREPWRFAEPTRRAVASWIRLRYRLLPYLYTLAHEAAATGAPMVRPLWWPDVPGGGPEAESEDAFLLGSALLVAPVFEPGAQRRDVPLPAGSWHAWWSDGAGAPARQTGSRRTVATPPERIPVLVRGGTVVPLDDGWAEAGGPCALEHDGDLPALAEPTLAPDHAPQLLAFHCWPEGGAATGVAVDDAGDGDGPRRRDELVLRGALSGGEAVLRWTRTGAFAAPARVRVVVHGLAPSTASADGRDVAVQGAGVTCEPFEELVLRGLRPAAAGEVREPTAPAP
jgi:alpha-glucosidase